MASFDSIVNVDEWISDHYLTTDEKKGDSFGKRVAARIKEWKQEEDDTDSRVLSPLNRLLAERQDLQTLLSQLGSEGSTVTSIEAHAVIRRALSYGEPTEHTAHRLGYDITYTAWISTGAASTGGLAVIESEPINTADEIFSVSPTPEPLTDGKESGWATSKLITELFLADDHPDFIAALAGDWVVLTNRESWPLGRYLAVNIGLAAERGDTKARGELHRVATILARENLEPAADGSTWWAATIEQSHQHAVQVSDDLREAVKRSIELIGNDVLQRHRDQGIEFDYSQGNDLARQSLRYLYRILFLLFAEATAELNILPVGTSEYDDGYGLARLRELVLDPPITERAQRGTHLYESLSLLFRLVDGGHDPEYPGNPNFDPDATGEGLTFRNLSADLFKQSATPLIDRVKLSNLALNKVLENLLLSPEKKGSDRGFISYATLGVAQLGQVYEGLMSFKGFVATEDLIEVAPKGNPSKGSWVVPIDNTDHLPSDCFVKETVEAIEGGTRQQNREFRRGSFVFRQSSRDRERSASFYSPPVITEFTVGQAIEELKESGRIAQASDILNLTICEPAMGSGAFAVEAVRQLAQLYLEMRQEELNTQIPGEDFTRELQKVKAHLALHQVYGVDLNETAVELAEISLWLDTMTPQLKAPWFGLHLRRGNSLIGASRKTYSETQLSDKSWITTPPSPGGVDEGRIFQFLLPGEGWGAAADSKDLKNLSPEIAERQKELKAWRRTLRHKLTKAQVKTLQGLSERAERLWDLASQRINIAEDQVRRDIDVWGHAFELTDQVVKRSEIEKRLGSSDGAFQRLKLVLDAWCALWFWPVTGETSPPTLDEWLDTMTALLGVPETMSKKTTARSPGVGQIFLDESSTWDNLNQAEDLDWTLSGARSLERCIDDHTWLTTVQEISNAQGFFHWELYFARVFTTGGFDLQVGNPPWVRPRTDVDALLSEIDPWFSLAHKPTQTQKRDRQRVSLQRPSVKEYTSAGIVEVNSTASFIGSVSQYPDLVNQQPDLYRAFMAQTWNNSGENGTVSLVHPESHFTEKKAAPLRRECYKRLRRHFQFINALMLFDIDDHVVYGVHVYGSKKPQVDFLNLTRMYHPSTAKQSFMHDGTGPIPGIKDDNFNWDIRPHKDRIVRVDRKLLKVWHSTLEDIETDLDETRMVYSVNTESAKVLTKLSNAPRVKEINLQYSAGWHETSDKKLGYFDTKWEIPETWGDVILQGPHLGVSTPMIKQPNPTMKHNQDWVEVDLESLRSDFKPATAYQPNRENNKNYDVDYGTWKRGSDNVAMKGTFRMAWREMAASTGFRTLYPAIIPPGSSHVHAVNSAWSHDTKILILSGAVMSSILADYMIRAAGSSHIFNDLIEKLPFSLDPDSLERVLRNFLRLNCLTEVYAPLWEKLTGENWTPNVPLRIAEKRREAQIEIDAIVACSLGITIEELCMIYRTQFPVMRKYDQNEHFDANGRKVPNLIIDKERRNGPLNAVDRTWNHPQSGKSFISEYPFRILDREIDLRNAYERLFFSE